MFHAPVMPTSPTLLQGIRWETYERLLQEVENPARLTFDRGQLEVVSPSYRHERWISLIGSAFTVLSLEVGVVLTPGGATTLRRRRLHRGMEPDACFWVGGDPRAGASSEPDFDVDPVPDLVMEAEASRSVLDRLAILDALGVGEVWRYDGQGLTVLLRQEQGGYRPGRSSRCLPWLPLDQLAMHLAAREQLDHRAWLVQLQAWVRDVVRPRFDRMQSG